MFKWCGLFAGACLIALANFSATSAKEEAEGKDIVATAVAGKFTKLVAAVQAADLVETLQGKGPFTVFAPTDKAFEALGEETLNAVLKDKKKLQAILTYHVVPGTVDSKQALAAAKGNKSVKTVQGSPIVLSTEGKSLVLNGKAKVVKADIKTTNGVIHVIDAVILPPAE